MLLARLSEQEISQIRAKADIVDVIGRYVPLTRKGKSYKCVCPFHDEDVYKRQDHQIDARVGKDGNNDRSENVCHRNLHHW